jgi:RED-like protein C-terminal region
MTKMGKQGGNERKIEGIFILWFNKDRGGSKKGQLKRWDFEDEESWNAYNDQREAMPKYVFCL